MNTITIMTENKESAKGILNRVYEADRSATFTGLDGDAPAVSGSVITAVATKETDSWSVAIRSDYYTVSSLNEMFA